MARSGLAAQVAQLAVAFWLLGCATSVVAGEVRVAIAANFSAPAREIGAAFEAATGHRTVLSFASTGQLYTQISHGAPFDVFLAADKARPTKAVEAGLAVASSQFTYATGSLVLFSADKNLVDGPNIIAEGRFEKIAVANPATAPYGAAALTYLDNLGLRERLNNKIVMGNNIAQTYQFIQTGNAELGFVAYSQIAEHTQGSRWVLPKTSYPSLAQDAVLLQHAADIPVAMTFLAFLSESKARKIMQRYGYGLAD